MKHRLIALGLLASAVGLAQAQSTRQLYLVKGKKVVATFPASDVDFITFDGTQQFYLPITLKQGEGTTIVMYNASDDWEKDPAERKFDQLAGQPVKFVWYSDYGFDGTLKITSASGDDVPYEYVTDDSLLYFRSKTSRKVIVTRTESDRTANGIRSDGGRNLIGRRTETVRKAYQTSNS